MPNWCTNTIYIVGKDEYDIHSLHERFLSYYGDAKKYHIAEILKAEGYTTRLDADGRDHLTYVDDDIYQDGEDYCFSIEIWSAWGPHLGWLYSLIRDKYGSENIDIYYLAEEPGMQILMSNDYDGRFFDEQYKLDCNSIKGGEHFDYFSTKEGLVTCLNDTYKTNFTTKDSIAFMESVIGELTEFDEDAYCSIQEVELTSDYEIEYWADICAA